MKSVNIRVRARAKEEKGLRGFTYLDVVRPRWDRWGPKPGHSTRLCKINFNGEMNNHIRQSVCGVVLLDSCASGICRGIASDKN